LSEATVRVRDAVISIRWSSSGSGGVVVVAGEEDCVWRSVVCRISCTGALFVLLLLVGSSSVGTGSLEAEDSEFVSSLVSSSVSSSVSVSISSESYSSLVDPPPPRNEVMNALVVKEVLLPVGVRPPSEATTTTRRCAGRLLLLLPPVSPILLLVGEDDVKLRLLLRLVRMRGIVVRIVGYKEVDPAFDCGRMDTAQRIVMEIPTVVAKVVVIREIRNDDECCRFTDSRRRLPMVYKIVVSRVFYYLVDANVVYISVG